MYRSFQVFIVGSLRRHTTGNSKECHLKGLEALRESLVQIRARCYNESAMQMGPETCLKASKVFVWLCSQKGLEDLRRDGIETAF